MKKLFLWVALLSISTDYNIVNKYILLLTGCSFKFLGRNNMLKRIKVLCVILFLIPALAGISSIIKAADNFAGGGTVKTLAGNDKIFRANGFIENKGQIADQLGFVR